MSKRQTPPAESEAANVPRKPRPRQPSQQQAPTQDESFDNQPTKAALGVTVSRRIREAMQARQISGIEEIWLDNEDQYEGFDEESIAYVRSRDPTVTTQVQSDGRSHVFLDITQPKTDSAVARVQEMLVPNDDKPWEIGPTPIPDIDKAIKENDQGMLPLADGGQAPRAIVAKMVMEDATKRSEQMGLWIEDRFVECGAYAEMRAVIRDAGRAGTGVLKGPYPAMRRDRKWSIDQATGTSMLEILERTSPASRRIDYRDFFPDPACGENIHNGSYVVERDYLTARRLAELAGLEGYDREAIIKALKEGPMSRGRDRDRFPDTPGETLADSQTYEVFYYYGDMTPEDLALLDVPDDQIGAAGKTEDELVLMRIPAIVTMLNDRPIKAVVNPLETGEFPYDLFRWKPVAGQPWGRGVPHKMATAQRMLNAAVRRMLENAGLSAGAQIVFMEHCIVPVNGRYEVVGPKLWKFTPTAEQNDITKAMAVFNIPSVQKEIQAIIDFALKMADELTNLPMLLQGQMGNAPDILGGMTMLENNANAPLRVIAKQFDDDIVVRHLNRYNDWGMQQDAPEGAKGDHQLKARGSTALVQRQYAREFLAQIYPVSDDPQLRINKIKLLAEMARSNGGFNLSSIQYTDAEWEQKQAEAAQNPPPQDPRIEAANIRNEGLKLVAQNRSQDLQAEQQFKQQQMNEDRAMAERVKNLELQIKTMELAGSQHMSLMQIKAMLAGKTMDSNDKRTEMQLKMAGPQANPSGTGI